MTATGVTEKYSLEEISNAVLALINAQTEMETEKNKKTYYVPEDVIREYKKIDNYPEIMRAKHVSEYLDISLAMAYNLLNSEGFPTLSIRNSKRVSKKSFIKFLDEHEGKHLF